MNVLQKYLLNILNTKETRQFHEVYGTEGIIWFRGYVNNMEENYAKISRMFRRKECRTYGSRSYSSSRRYNI